LGGEEPLGGDRYTLRERSVVCLVQVGIEKVIGEETEP